MIIYKKLVLGIHGGNVTLALRNTDLQFDWIIFAFDIDNVFLKPASQ